MSRNEASVSIDQVLAALQRGELAARPFQAVHIDPRRARPMKKYKPDTGEVTGEIGSNVVLDRLLDDAKIRHQELEAIDRQEAKKAWDAVHARRAMGIPDFCATCLKPLSMKPTTVISRNLKDVPIFRCASCSSSIARASRMKRVSSLSDEQRREMMRPVHAGLADVPKEVRAANQRAATRGWLKKLETMTPERRRETTQRARNGLVQMTDDQRSEKCRKAWETRRAKAANG